MPLYFLMLFACGACGTTRFGARLWDLERESSTPGDSMYVPVITTDGENFTTNRLAIYDGYRVAAVLNPEQTVAEGYLLGNTVKQAVQVSLGPGQKAGLSALSAVGSSTLQRRSGRLYITENLHFTATLDELVGLQASTPVIQKLEQVFSRTVTRSILATVELTQRHGSNPTGVGLRLLWQDPSLIPEWWSLYRNADVTVHATTTIHDVGDAK